MLSLLTLTLPIDNPSRSLCGTGTRRAIQLAVCLAACLALGARADSTHFDCDAVTKAGEARQLELASELLEASYDTGKLACAAKVFITRADSHRNDYGDQLAALQANARYIYYLDRVILYELGYLIDWYVVEVPKDKKMNEPMIAMVAARDDQQRLLRLARAAGFAGAELDYYEAALVGPNAAALPLLQSAVAADPQSLHGAAHALLAETYYALPDIAGGDLDKAIGLMRSALQRAPDNPRYARLLAGYLSEQGKSGEAQSILQQILAMEADAGGLQLQADQLRAASDLAKRIGEAGLAGKLSERRISLLEAHPELQSRLVVSAMGHFGDKNPMEDATQDAN